MIFYVTAEVWARSNMEEGYVLQGNLVPRLVPEENQVLNQPTERVELVTFTSFLGAKFWSMSSNQTVSQSCIQGTHFIFHIMLFIDTSFPLV